MFTLHVSNSGYSNGFKHFKEEHMCRPCCFRDSFQEASFWCIVCKEGLCSSCKKYHLSIKALRSHNVLPFQERQSIPEILEQVQQTCFEHDRKWELYCSDHREPCCIRYSTLNHKGCQNVCPIEDVITNVKSSTAAYHIEEGIDKMISKLHKIIEKKEEASSSFKSQVKTAKKDVAVMKKCLENKLDDICKELNAEIDDYKLEYDQGISKQLGLLQERLKNICALKSSITLTKEKGTNLQFFMCLEVFEEALSKQETFLSTSTEKGEFSNREILLKLYDDIKNALKVENFGKIEIKTNPLELFSGSLSQSPKIMGKSNDNFTVNIDSMKLNKKKEIKFSAEKVTSCVILPNGSFLLTDFSNNNRLMLYDANCMLLRYIPTECPPFGIAILNPSTIATTLSRANKVVFIELLSNEDKVMKQINLIGECFGIDTSGNRLAIAVKGYGIQLISVDGTFLKTIPFACTALSFNGTYIYYVEKETDKLRCCDYNGHNIWEIAFPETNFKDYPSLSIDEGGNVYIAERSGDKFL
ncbi:unnamed protein product [Mytilus edulis]|uniref:B box-type domain-containing protein n=1 Tax=Mytilus edulis TaxID=6550 RepID=A0A8S3QM72_MYTED|nr:unnamed protein product [Mytilus edulis]